MQSIPGNVLLIVLAGAFLHASWNALVKSDGDKFLNAVLIMLFAALIAGSVLPFLDQPAPASWPFVATSAVLQALYVVLVASAYKSGDMSLAYPLMRGSAPLLVALVSLPLIGEPLPALRWAGILIVSGGIMIMAWESLRRSATYKFTVATALLNACFIAAYTVTDGIGVRKSDAAIAYTLWIFVLHAMPLVAWALYNTPNELVAVVKKRALAGFLGGFCTIGSYGAALWAMSLYVPVASVAALRETSILFATGISAVLLKEHIGKWRLLGISFIVGGVVVIRLS